MIKECSLDSRTAALPDPFHTADTQYRVTDGSDFTLPVDPAYLDMALTLTALGWIEARTADGPWEVIAA